MSAGDWPWWKGDNPAGPMFMPDDKHIGVYHTTTSDKTELVNAENYSNLEILLGGVIEYEIRLKYKGWEFSGDGTAEYLDGHPEQMMTDPVDVRFAAPVRIKFKKIIYAHWKHFHRGKDQPFAEKVLAFEGTNWHGNPIYGAFLPQDIQLRGIKRIHIPRRNDVELLSFSRIPTWFHGNDSSHLLDGLATLLGHNPDSLSI
jgi:hypothetical protein